MHKKKQRIIEVGMKLFANQGFHATSIQEIAEKSGVSKGGFYLHFQSKEELILSIYQYYFERAKEKVVAVKSEQLPPREQLSKQLFVHFEEFLKQKEFVVMMMRENFSINDELDAFMLTIRKELMTWYELAILRIYGDDVKPYIVDGAVLLEGLITSYLKIFLFDQVEIDLKKLSNFLIDRLDDLIQSLIEKKPDPLLKKEMLPLIYTSTDDRYKKAEVKHLLFEAEQVMEGLKIESEQKNEVITTLQILKEEIEKEEPQALVFQGMLTNVKEIEKLDHIRKSIAEKMDIQLL